MSSVEEERGLSLPPGGLAPEQGAFGTGRRQEWLLLRSERTWQVAVVMADHVRENGDEVRTGQRVRAVERRPSSFVLRSAAGDEIEARALVNCAGLQPWAQSKRLVRNLTYP